MPKTFLELIETDLPLFDTLSLKELVKAREVCTAVKEKVDNQPLLWQKHLSEHYKDTEFDSKYGTPKTHFFALKKKELWDAEVKQNKEFDADAHLIKYIIMGHNKTKKCFFEKIFDGSIRDSGRSMIRADVMSHRQECFELGKVTYSVCNTKGY